MIEVDARGLSCPLPVMRTAEALGSDPARVVVLVDSGTAKANVSWVLSERGYDVSVTEDGTGWRVAGSRASAAEGA